MNETTLQQIEARCRAAHDVGECGSREESVFHAHATGDVLALIAALREAWAKLDAITDVGVYPKAFIGGENAYEKRTEFMEGWNACTMEACRINTLNASEIQALRDSEV